VPTIVRYPGLPAIEVDDLGFAGGVSILGAMLDKAGIDAACADKCDCNSVCGCDADDNCCESKCGCDQVKSADMDALVLRPDEYWTLMRNLTPRDFQSAGNFQGVLRRAMSLQGNK